MENLRYSVAGIVLSELRNSLGVCRSSRRQTHHFVVVKSNCTMAAHDSTINLLLNMVLASYPPFLLMHFIVLNAFKCIYFIPLSTAFLTGQFSTT